MRVEQLQREYPVEVTWLPFELHPELPPEGLPREQLFPETPRSAEYREHLRGSAAATGLIINSTPIIAASRKALEAAEFARDAGRLDELGRALFRAYFTEGKNIGLVDVLCELAAEAGLDATVLRTALEEGRYAERVTEQSDWAKGVGVTGTPTFIFDRKYALVGAQPYEVFEQVMERLGVEKAGVAGG